MNVIASKLHTNGNRSEWVRVFPGWQLAPDEEAEEADEPEKVSMLMRSAEDPSPMTPGVVYIEVPGTLADQMDKTL